MWKEEGFAGFMKGNGINVIRVSCRRTSVDGNIADLPQILPYSALQFTVSSPSFASPRYLPLQSYGGFKTLLRQWSGTDDLSTPLRLAAGAGAGIVAVSESARPCIGMFRLMTVLKVLPIPWILYELGFPSRPPS